MSLSSLVLEYYNLLISLTKKIRVNVFWKFFFAIKVFLLNQLFLVIAFFLPLKVIIMIGTDGVPRYLRFFIDESNKNDYISIIAFLAVIFYFSYLLTEALLSKVGKSAAIFILARSNKMAMFERQNEFSTDVFLRVVRTWGTIFMVLAGFLIGFILEWRIFLVLSFSVVLEFLILSLVWSVSQKPENVKLRNSFLDNRLLLLNAISAINFFIGFAVLFYLFATNAIVNFIVGIFLILLLRQIFQRTTAAINDAVFLSQQKSKIIGIFYTHTHYYKSKNHEATTLESRLKPSSRDELFSSISLNCKGLDSVVWNWFDSSEKDTAVFTDFGNSESFQYWMKLYPANKESAFEQAKAMYIALSTDKVPHAPVLHTHGYCEGVFYIILSTDIAQHINFRNRKRSINNWLVETWKVPPPTSIANILERSLPPLSARLSKANLSMIMLATRNEDERETLGSFITMREVFVDYIEKSPKYIMNSDLSEFNTIFLGSNLFSLLHWSKVSIEPVCSDIQLRKLGKAFNATEIAESLRRARTDCSDFTDIDVKRIVYLCMFDKFLSQARYRSAFDLVKPILRYFDE